MFLTTNNKLLVNEIAPRVHNSGHYTIECCMTSQFAQHIRAISGLPLGDTAMLTPASVMINILGDRTGKAHVKGLSQAIKIPGVFVHIYGKEETRPERKMGHITVVGNSLTACLRKAKQARSLISI
jgi:5-(carboxyamino)imidazole ribonucleotide synthase